MLRGGGTEGTQTESKISPRVPKMMPRSPQETPNTKKQPPKWGRGNPKSTQNELKPTTKSPKAKCVKIIPDEKHANRAGAEAPARFSMPGQRRQANLFSAHVRSSGGHLGSPWGLRFPQETSTMIGMTCLDSTSCFSPRLILLKPLRTGRVTPCEGSPKRF